MKPNRLTCEKCILIDSLRYRAAALEKAARKQRPWNSGIADEIQKSADLNYKIAGSWDKNHPEHSKAN
jgi:hypothetical protein